MTSETTRAQFAAAQARQAAALDAVVKAQKELEAAWCDFAAAAQLIEQDYGAVHMSTGEKP